MTHRLKMAAQIFRFFVIGFNTDFPHTHIHPAPSLFQVRIKIRFVAWEIVTLKTEIYALFLIAIDDATIRIFARTLPTPLIVRVSKIGEHFLKFRIVRKYREKVRKTFGKNIEITNQFLKLFAMESDISFCKGETFPAA
jgi:hypothetical protein